MDEVLRILTELITYVIVSSFILQWKYCTHVPVRHVKLNINGTSLI